MGGTIVTSLSPWPRGVHYYRIMAVLDPRFPILAGLTSPHDLHRMSDAQLEALAQEMREAIIDTVSRTGGHLGASLGTVELTIALHSELESPRDTRRTATSC